MSHTKNFMAHHLFSCHNLALGFQQSAPNFRFKYKNDDSRAQGHTEIHGTSH
jgi:hypothetical protein